MKKLFRSTVLLGLAAMLLIASVAAGCGGGSAKAENIVVLGWMGDQTGPASSTFGQVQWGIDDYISRMDPIPGVKIQFATYDFREEYARVPVGYQWLMNQGMDLLLHYNPNVQAVTAGDQADDKIPSFSFNVDLATAGNEWVFGYSVTLRDEAMMVMDYLLKDWWETKGMTRPIKIGAMVHSDLGSGTIYWQAYQEYAAAHPGKCVLTRASGTSGQTAWASEVAALKDSDVIIVGTIGPAAATFLKELFLRGYQGSLVSHSISVLSIWSMVTAIVPKADMDGILIPHAWHVWTDDNPFVAEMKTALEESRPADAQMLKEGTTWLSGYCMAYILTNIVRAAAEKVGAENVDGTALRDALAETQLDIPGMPTIGGYGNQCLNPAMRMIKYNAAEDKWYAVNDWVNTLEVA